MSASAKKSKSTKKQEGRTRGQVVNKGNGTYLVRVPLPTGLDGKRRSASKVIRGTYRQADQLRVKMLGELDTGGIVVASQQLVAHYLEQWLSETASLRVSPRTLNMYRYLVNRYVLPVIGTQKLSNLTHESVQGVYSRMVAAGLGHRIVRYTHTVLKSALTQAVVWRKIQSNPCDGATLPRVTRNEPKVFTAAQICTILDAAADSEPWGIMWNLLLNTGMRPQEAAALTWADIDGDKLRITKALVEVSPGNYSVQQTKTARSMRTITIPQGTVDALAAHRLYQTKWMLKSGSAYERNNLVIATRSGTTICLHNAYRAWKAMLRRLKLPDDVTMYGCRHTHISLLLASGEPGPAVAERAGHSLDVMMKVYAHVIPETVPQIAGNFERMLRRQAQG